MFLRSRILWLSLWLAAVLPAVSATPGVLLEEMTSPQVAAAVAAGRRIIIIPVGGTEQNGPHMALGKHNVRALALATRIAGELGDALVAPVVAYVPEGSIAPPSAHMRHAGTISIPDAAFRGLLDGAARSFAAHGFTTIVLLGDHGGYQSQLKAVAETLNRQWQGRGVQALFLADYYAASQAPYNALLRQHGLSDAQIGSHAGAADTALQLAVDPGHVWREKMPESVIAGKAVGVSGDARAATAQLGQQGVELIVQRSVAAIRRATAKTP